VSNMVICSYSGKEIPTGQGKMYVRKDGRVLYFYSNKEFKFYQMKRKPVKMGWTAEARKAKQMRMAAEEHEKKDAPKKVKTKSADAKPSRHALKEQKKEQKAKTKQSKEAKKKPAKAETKAPAQKEASSAQKAPEPKAEVPKTAPKAAEKPSPAKKEAPKTEDKSQ